MYVFAPDVKSIAVLNIHVQHDVMVPVRFRVGRAWRTTAIDDVDDDVVARIAMGCNCTFYLCKENEQMVEMTNGTA